MKNAESTITESEHYANKQSAISAGEKTRREKALAFAIASVGLEGFHVSKEYEIQAQRFVNGEMAFAELTQYVYKSMPLIPTGERQRREHAVNFANASVGLEGFKQSPEAEAHALRFINGEIDLEEYLAKSFQDVHGKHDLDC